MEKYTRVVFDAKYENEHFDKRYARLLKSLDANIANLKHNNDSTADIIVSFAKQMSDLRAAIYNCWQPSQSIFLSRKVNDHGKKETEFYLIETLARLEMAFDNPSDMENNNELILLAQEIPGNWAGAWYAVKAGLTLLAELALIIAAAMLFPAVMEIIACSAIGLIVYGAIVMPSIPFILIIPLLFIEMIKPYDVHAANDAFNLQHVKTGLLSMSTMFKTTALCSSNNSVNKDLVGELDEQHTYLPI